MSSNNIKWDNAKPELVLRVVQEGDSYLSGQLRLATSADQRASILAGVFTTAGTALLAGVIALEAGWQGMHITEKWPIYAGGGTAVLMFLIAAGFCIASIFPVGFWLPGNEPESWYRDIEAGRDVTEALAEEAEHIQSKIVDNRTVVRANARRFKAGAVLGVTAPIAGFLVWIVSSSSLWISM